MLNARSHITAASATTLDAPYPAICAPRTTPTRTVHERAVHQESLLQTRRGGGDRLETLYVRCGRSVRANIDSAVLCEWRQR
jgi:hypothetical protein